MYVVSQNLSNENPMENSEKHSSLHNGTRSNRYFCWIKFNKIDWAGFGASGWSIVYNVFTIENFRTDDFFFIKENHVWHHFQEKFSYYSETSGKQIAYEIYSCVNWINFNFHFVFALISMETQTPKAILLCRDWNEMMSLHKRPTLLNKEEKRKQKYILP